ncbi:hypothetical protein Ancab_025363 [Ancistrocladus abbreviatus]
MTTTIPRESSVNDELVPGKSRKDDLSQDAKCRIDGVEIYSKSFGERVNKTQENRPEHLETTEHIQRVFVLAYSPPLGLTQLKTNRCKGKRTKKRLMEDILQMRLSKRVISKGQIRRKFGRHRNEMEANRGPLGQPSSSESIQDSQIINSNKIIMAKANSPECSELNPSPKEICEFLLQLGIVDERNEEDTIRCIEEIKKRDVAMYTTKLQKRGVNNEEVGNGCS